MRFLGFVLLAASLGCSWLVAKTSAELKVLKGKYHFYVIEDEAQRTLHGNTNYTMDEEMGEAVQHARQKRILLIFLEIVLFVGAVYLLLFYNAGLMARIIRRQRTREQNQ